jgi:hypothetical protein
MAKTYRIVDRGIGGRPVIQAKESDIQRAILDWLAAERIWHIRLNTGAMAGSHKGKRWFVRFGRPGLADILAVKPYRAPMVTMNSSATQAGVCFSLVPWQRPHWATHTVKGYSAGQAYELPAYWIEVKTAKGTQSDDQKRFQKEVTEQGMTYILARDLSDVIAALK